MIAPDKMELSINVKLEKKFLPKRAACLYSNKYGVQFLSSSIVPTY